MALAVCLISAGLSVPSTIGPLLERCGLEVWTPDSPHADDGHIYNQAICLVIDMPGDTGIATLKLLRDYGVMTPALLVVDAGHKIAVNELGIPYVLDVLPRTVKLRTLLYWIQSMCVAQKLLKRVVANECANTELMYA